MQVFLPKLLIFSIGLAILSLLSLTNILDWLLIQDIRWIIAGLLFLGAVVVLLSRQVSGEAEVLAESLGEPYGTLVLTGSVIIIELRIPSGFLGFSSLSTSGF